MQQKTMAECVRLAREFEARVKAYHDACKAGDTNSRKLNGSIRRASMELTRALADLRQNR